MPEQTDKSTKRVLLINDLAGYGKVALSAMIPVFSHLRYDTCNLPTALVSNTLDYDSNRALNESAYIGWTTTGHTGGPVPVYALGAGAERFGGRYDNTDIMRKILAE